ncbi:MAG: hypothetical protein H6730_12115 [Deltaproteobacteria bacterium]|nr:hypothetical protein [Deltaproteobacteria bacterium]
MRQVCMLGLLALAAACGSEPFEAPGGRPGRWVLVDLVHTQLQNPLEHRLTRGDYAYQGVHGYARLFDHLAAHGYPWTATRTLRLSDSLLEGFSVLFINLLHEGADDFTQDEIDAIHRFVARGGGLFVVADHSNVYRHAERINRVLVPMGMEVRYLTALDSPAHSVAGSAWILIDNLAAHPTNEGVALISFQTGGVLGTDAGTAFLSEDGFGDLWDEANEDGFYGNWRFDGDEAVEPRGADLPVVAATEYGEGRVFVVGDQNVYGDVWLHFADNFAHATNAFEWLAGGPEVAPPLRERPVDGLDLAVELTRAGFALGQGASDRYYGLYHHLNRHHGVTARATTRLDVMRDALMIPTPREAYDAAAVEAVQAYLRAGRRVILLLDVSMLTAPAVALLRQLAPDFSFEMAGQPADLSGEPRAVAARFAAVPRLQGRRPVTVGPPGRLDFNPEALARLQVGARISDEGDGDEAFVVLDVTSSWGLPLFAAGGRDLARVAPVEAGELVIFLQDGLLRSRTLGRKESEPPPPGGEAAAELLYGLLDYLRTPVAF